MVRPIQLLAIASAAALSLVSCSQQDGGIVGEGRARVGVAVAVLHAQHDYDTASVSVDDQRRSGAFAVDESGFGYLLFEVDVTPNEVLTIDVALGIGGSSLRSLTREATLDGSSLLVDVLFDDCLTASGSRDPACDPIQACSVDADCGIETSCTGFRCLGPDGNRQCLPPQIRVGAPCGERMVCAASGACVEYASCDDGVANGDESDVDCGGACSPCELEERCGSDVDCASAACTDGVCATECGNGLLEDAEYCDDGNLSDDDGCSASCLVESGGDCVENVACDEGLYCRADSRCGRADLATVAGPVGESLFGYPMDANGDMLAVGDRMHETVNLYEARGETMTLVRTITAPVSGVRFAYQSISLNADWLAVAAPNESAVYLYDLASAASAPIRIGAPAGATGFGRDVDLAGDMMVIDGLTTRPDGMGRIDTIRTVWTYTSDGTAWSLQSEISDLRFNAILTRPVVTNGARIAVGGYLNDDQVGIFYQDAGIWVLERTIASPSATSGIFGRALAIDGDSLLIGDPNEDIEYAPSGILVRNAGAIYQFDLSTGSQVSKLTGATPFKDAFFGMQLDLSSKYLVARSAEDGCGEDVAYSIDPIPGLGCDDGHTALYIWRRSSTGFDWHAYIPGRPEQRFTRDVAASDRVFAGARDSYDRSMTGQGEYQGFVSVFD